MPTAVKKRPVVVIDGAEYVAEPDPFGEFTSLVMSLDPLDIGSEGPGATIARQDERGDWTRALRCRQVALINQIGGGSSLKWGSPSTCRAVGILASAGRDDFGHRA